jgi:hypothetical protein
MPRSLSTLSVSSTCSFFASSCCLSPLACTSRESAPSYARGERAHLGRRDRSCQLEHAVRERRLAMVDMCNHSEVPQLRRRVARQVLERLEVQKHERKDRRWRQRARTLLLTRTSDTPAELLNPRTLLGLPVAMRAGRRRATSDKHQWERKGSTARLAVGRAASGRRELTSHDPRGVGAMARAQR